MRVRLALLLAAVLPMFLGADYRTENFVVRAADARVAEQYARSAERYRRELALQWLGEELPAWNTPCVMTLEVSPELEASGKTRFVFERGEVFGWRMHLRGSAEQIEQSILPHEMTHAIFATHFRAPLPRWADEGGATNAECPRERAVHNEKLAEFLRAGRGIAFDRLFQMAEYPEDVMPLYAEAHSLVAFLVERGGRRKYVEYLADGMRTRDWRAATERWYGVKDLRALESMWMAWATQDREFPIPGAATPERSIQSPMLAAMGN